MKKILMLLAIAGAVYVSASDVFTKVDLHPSVVWLKNADGSSVLTTASGQPLDDNLTSIAALGTAADKMLYTTAEDTWAEAAITAAGRALMDDADADAQRTTLGLAIGTNVQAAEDQRVSTTDSPSFVSVTASGNEVAYLTTYNTSNVTATTWYDPTNQVMRITEVIEAAE
jgi:hypothetical protein